MLRHIHIYDTHNGLANNSNVVGRHYMGHVNSVLMAISKCPNPTLFARAPYTVIQRAMHIHPTVSELVPTMLGELEPFN